MNLVVKPVLTDTLSVIPVGIIIWDTVGAVAFSIRISLKGMCIVRRKIVTIFYATVLKTGSSIEKILITGWIVQLDILRVFLYIRKNLVSNLASVYLTICIHQEEKEDYWTKNDNWKKCDVFQAVPYFEHGDHHLLPIVYHAYEKRSI